MLPLVYAQTMSEGPAPSVRIDHEDLMAGLLRRETIALERKRKSAA